MLNNKSLKYLRGIIPGATRRNSSKKCEQYSFSKC